MHTTDERRCQCGGCDKPAHVALGVSGQLACVDCWRNERFVSAKDAAMAFAWLALWRWHVRFDVCKPGTCRIIKQPPDDGPCCDFAAIDWSRFKPHRGPPVLRRWLGEAVRRGLYVKLETRKAGELYPEHAVLWRAEVGDHVTSAAMDSDPLHALNLALLRRCSGTVPSVEPDGERLVLPEPRQLVHGEGWNALP